MPNYLTSINFPANPTVGQNYTYGSQTYQWSGSEWVAAINAVNNAATVTRQVFSGTGSQTVFNLAADPGALGNSAQVYINGVYQQRSTYTIAGSTLTFSAAPVAGTNNIEFLNFQTSNIGTTSADLVTYTPAGAGAVARSASSKFGDVVSVKDFGAVGDGVADDTAAFQAALNAAKGANNTGQNRTVFAIYVPSCINGFYKITDTLVIDGTHGLRIFGDGAFTQRDNYPGLTSTSTIQWHGNTRKPIFQVYGQTNAISNPNFLITIEDLTISGYPTYVSAGSIPANMALSGIHLGSIDGANTPALNRQVTLKNLFISNCRFGIWSGAPDGQNTDFANVHIESCFIVNCPNFGLVWGTGNAIAFVYNCFIANNGYASFGSDDYAPDKPSNIYVNSGHVDFYSLTTAGEGNTKPVYADIVQQSGRVSITNAWLEAQGICFKQESASTNGVGYYIAQLTGLRHFNGSFTAANTPDSIVITAPGTTVTSCFFYGNVIVQSGLGGRPVFIGTNFGRADSTYKGSGIDTQRSLIEIGSAGNFAQIKMGGVNSGVAFTQKNSGTTPFFLLGSGSNAAGGGFQPVGIIEAIPSSSSGTGFRFNARLDDAAGQNTWLFNCYSLPAGTIVPYQNNKICHRLNLGGPNGFEISVADPNNSSSPLTFSQGFELLIPPIVGYHTENAFKFPARANDPYFSSPNFFKGSVYYNTTTNKLRVNNGTTWIDLH
jgi:hypothetical protein